MLLKQHAYVMILDPSLLLLETYVKTAQQIQIQMLMILTVSVMLVITNKVTTVSQNAQLMPPPMPMESVSAQEVNSSTETNVSNHLSALTDQHSIQQHSTVSAMTRDKTLLVEFVKNVNKIQFGIMDNVSVQLDFSILEESVDLVILDLNIMELTVFVN